MTRLRTTCNRDCPDACAILATVEGGRVTRIQGDPEHPVTRGFLCYRTNRFLSRQYDSSRLTSPLLRRNGELRPASWDESLDYIASKLVSVREESGPSAILHYRSGGSLGLMKHIVDYFFEQFGPVAVKSGDICSGAGDTAQMIDFGEEDSHDLFDLLNSRTILLWGKNPFVSNVHLIPVLRDARARSTRMALVDPVHHRGASLCDRYVQVRPGGDIALACGMIRWLFDHNAVDPAAGDYCDNLEDLQRVVEFRSLVEWARLAGVNPTELDYLAELYAEGPSAILVGWGLQRRARGCAAVRLLDALGAVSGNIGISGGGVSFYFKRRGAFDLSFVGGLAKAPRSIPEPLLGPGILAASDPPIRIVWVTCGNPVAMLPDSQTVARALRSREMTVVVDSFLTDTAREADVVLPTTTMLEDDDLVGAYGHHWLGEIRPVTAAPPGVRTDHEILLALAPRVGLGESFRDTAEDWKRRLLSRVAPKGASLEALRQGPVRNPEAPRLLFADRRFSTATGRVNLIREVDPEPPRPTEQKPLLLMALSTERAQASQWAAPAEDGPAPATVHPDSAAGFAEGDIAQIVSDTGTMSVRLHLDSRQRRDVVLVSKGGWLSAGRCANALIRAKVTDAGEGACYYDTPVALVPLDV